MKFCIALALALGMLAIAVAQDGAVKKEVNNLQGTWVRIYMEADGKKSIDGKKEPGTAITLIIKGDKYGDDKFTLDPAKQPKHIDVSMIDGKGKTTTLRGIYELKGDVLKLCFPFPFEGKLDKIGRRPTEFGTKPGGNDVLEVYKREKK